MRLRPDSPPNASRIPLAAIAAVLIATGSPALASSATFSLTTADGPDVTAGRTVTLAVRSTHDTTIASSGYDLTASVGAMAVVDVRMVEPGLNYVTRDGVQPDPFLPGLDLPHELNVNEPLEEVLLGLDKAWRPGTPGDGIAPGTDVLLATLTVRLFGRGPVTIGLTDVTAAETQSNPAGRLFDTVTVDPSAGTVTFNLALDADSDDDGDVDQSDFGSLQACLRDQGVPVPFGCQAWDLDGDGDVDRIDYALFEGCSSGPAVAAAPDCLGQFAGRGAAHEPPTADEGGILLPTGLLDAESPPIADSADELAGTFQACVAGADAGTGQAGDCGESDADAGPPGAGRTAAQPRLGIEASPGDPRRGPDHRTPLRVGSTEGPRPAPAFKLIALDSGVITVPAADAQILVLNFVSPNCRWCRRQIRDIERVDIDYWNKGVRVVNVFTLSEDQASDAELLAFADGLGSRTRIARDADRSAADAFATALRTEMVYPTTFVIDAEGRIAETLVGAGRTGALRARLDVLLGRPSQVRPVPKTAGVTPQDEGGGFVPTTYAPTKSIQLLNGHKWIFPVMMGRGTPGTEPESLHFNTNLDIRYSTDWLGRYFCTEGGFFTDTFGLLVHDGSAPWTGTPPAAVQMIEYMAPACAEAYRNPNTPLPPAFSEAKASADQLCVDTCGEGFSMTDFDMNQWRYTCFPRMTASGPRAYQVATWGGAECAKTIDNGLIEACNPLTGMTAVRRNLGGPLAECPECDLNNDGIIALDDLIRARNRAYGPRRAGSGYTFQLIRWANTTIEESVNLVPLVAIQNGETGAVHIEVTHWNGSTPVDCYNPTMNKGCLEELTQPHPGGTGYLGQDMADEYCGVGYCKSNGLGYSIGHCRINPDGSHSIRISAGYCYDCM